MSEQSAAATDAAGAREMRATAVAKAAARSAADKLAALRALMRGARLAAYVVPTADAHNSEYVSDRDQRRTFISGFTGSAGTAVVTLEHGAHLWTDGRYYLQASTELDAGAGWQLKKDRLPETPTIEAWLAATLARGDAVGVDPFTFTYGAVKRMRPVLEAAGLALTTSSPEAQGSPAPNLVDAVWGADQPPAPCSRVWVHDAAHAGATVGDKLAAIRAALAKEGAQALVLAALDEVAWAFNIRGADVECNPVAIAYGLVTADGRATLCIDTGKLDDAARAHLAAAGVDVAPYDAAPALARALPGRVWLDPSTVNYALYQQVVEGDAKAAGGGAGSAPPSSAAAARVLEKMSPVQLLKAVKNPVEAQGAWCAPGVWGW
jgi:Xaa-Pro aminopeptidase